MSKVWTPRLNPQHHDSNGGNLATMVMDGKTKQNITQVNNPDLECTISQY